MLVAALGAPAEIAGYGLAGVVLCPAEDAEQVRSAWMALPDEVGLVILTWSAAAALSGTGVGAGSAAADLGRDVSAAGRRLVAVMPG